MINCDDLIGYARKKALDLGVLNCVSHECATREESNPENDCQLTFGGEGVSCLIINYDCMLDFLENQPDALENAHGLDFTTKKGKKRADYLVSAISKEKNEHIFIVEMTRPFKRPDKARAQLGAGLKVAEEFLNHTKTQKLTL